MPYPLAEPISDDSHQPLYGGGYSLQPLYVQPPEDQNKTCFVDAGFYDEYCLVTVRNNPLPATRPWYYVSMSSFPFNFLSFRLLIAM
jgi:hypothetical protein